MLRHNLLLFFRNIKKNKNILFINIAGLSTALACVLLIYLWVNDELKVDSFHQNKNRLFQVMMNTPLATGVETEEYTPGLLAKTLNEEMPEVEAATAVIPPQWFDGGQGIASAEDRHFKAVGQFIDEDYFKLFSWKMISGNTSGVLEDKQSIFISEKLANKLFSKPENAIGKTISWERGRFSGIYTVSGVFKDPPENSTHQFEILFNYLLFYEAYEDNLTNWGNSNPSTFVLLKEGVDSKAFDQKIEDLAKEKYRKTVGEKYLEYIGTLFIQPVSERYLYSKFENGVQAGGRITYVKLFSVIAIFMLLIAAINFMNLSTAIASKRMKEIGIKKAVGARQRNIVWQFINESVFIAFLSLCVALLMVAILLPEFNEITGKHLSLSFSAEFILSIILITLFTGLLSGSYPALYLSRFRPVKVLKGTLSSPRGEAWTRKGLVVFQFTVSVVLIVSVLIVYKQIEYTQNKNLGYSKENIISFKKEGKLNENLVSFVNEIRDLPGVAIASSFQHDLVGDSGSTSGVKWDGKKAGERVEFGNIEVDYNLMELLDMQMIAGRTYSEEFGTDKDDKNIILNEEAIKVMGLEDPVGKTITLWGKERQIIGVVKNFHFRSLYEKLGPCMVRFSPEGQNILVKLETGSEEETINRISEAYGAFTGGLPFEYTYLDKDYNRLYIAEQRVSVLSKYFASLAILISCLGLFGLAAYTAERKRKEIGIRKTLGQASSQLTVLLSASFVKLVVLSLVIGLPLAYLIGKNWLSGFAYRIELHPWYFVLAGIITLSIALITISTQAIRAAHKNPVDALREE
ncbi:FtsX-like permease family protein [Leptobacterium flavescens]|uniref:FtsX-like permease family protein n=1 Tax=Leptobacterium flavescens TaxID=472055 RepID=A0A6P0UMD0_9FLAO|nr:ABC transporter permease [Leptobacterium flavescens]NER13028.1 FtsX-like permease family protein [Leptobacterium flavescens]